MMFLQQLQRLQSLGMGPMGGGSSGSSGGGGMSGANGRDGGSSFGSSAGISGQGNLGSHNGGYDSGNDGSSTRAANDRIAADRAAADAAREQAARDRAAKEAAEKAARTARQEAQAVSADARRADYAGSSMADRRGMTTRDGVSEAVGNMAQNGWKGSLAGFAAGTLAAPAGPIGSALASAGAKAAVGTQAQRASEARVTGSPETSFSSGMVDRAVPSIGGSLGGQAGSTLGGQIGGSIGGVPGAVVGSLGGGLLGSALGTNMATGIMNGEGVSTGFGAMSGSAGSDFIHSISKPQTQTQQPIEQPQGNAYGWQGYDSSFGNYGSHNSQFVGNPNRARNAFR